MSIWQFISESPGEVALLYVTESKGSSPGRKGFKMAVRRGGELYGSIGGGIMEQRLVEWAQARLENGLLTPELRKQIHRPGEGDAYSGLICSGEQTVAFVGIDPIQAPFLAESSGWLTLSEAGLQYRSSEPDEFDGWAVISLAAMETVSIIGGGHVGLSLSRTMSQLGFRVEVFDDRADLNTIEQNQYADKKHIGDLSQNLASISEGANAYVVVVTFGIAVDRTVLEVLKDKSFRYFGLMGSRSKIRVLEQEFGSLEHLHTPIGLPIQSHTPEEIAVSIAAEIIQVKNSTSVISKNGGNPSCHSKTGET